MFRLIRWYWRLRGNKIHHTAIIYPCVRMGKGNYIGPFCVIGAHPDYLGKLNESKGVDIGNGNRFTSHVMVQTGVEQKTLICNNCMIMGGAYIAHDCWIERNCTISAGARLAGYVHICHNVNIGLDANVHQRCTVHEYCMLGMGTVYTKSTKEAICAVYVGNPAKILRANDK